MPYLTKLSGLTSVAVMVLLVGSVQAQQAQQITDEEMRKHARALDVVARKVEQYGIITASAPLLVRADGDGGRSQFEFALGEGAKKYYSDARQDIQGAVAASIQSLTNVEVQARYGVDTTAPRAYAAAVQDAEAKREQRQAATMQIAAVAKAEFDAIMALADKESDLEKRRQMIVGASDRYQAALKSVQPAEVAIPTASMFGGAPKPTDILASPNIAAGANGLNPMQAPFALNKLLTNSGPTVTNRSAIIAAAGDNTVEGIFRLLGDPGKAMEFSGRTAFFGVTMVSVTPGQRTRKKYAADITLQASLTAVPVDVGEVRSLPALTGMATEHLARLLCDSRDPTTLQPCRLPVSSLMSSYRLAAVDAAKRSPTLSEFVKEFKDAQLDLSAVIGAQSVQAPDAQTVWTALSSDTRAGEIDLQEGSGPEGAISAKVGPLRCAGRIDAVDLLCIFREEYSPTVAAVSPMTESQVLDLGLAQRDKQRFALDLAARLVSAGDDRSARVFAEFAKQVESDSVTRTPQNLVTGYSLGSTFGYQVGPAYTAIERPGNSEPKSGQILQRQSFPALLVLGVRSDVTSSRVYLVKRRYKRGEVDRKLEYLVVLKPHITLQQSWRWTPLQGLLAPWRRLAETERVDWMRRLDEIPVRSDAPGDFVSARAELYRQLVGLRSVSLPLPSDPMKQAKLAEVLPSRFNLDVDKQGSALPTTASFVMRGVDLNLGSKVQCQARVSGPPIPRTDAESVTDTSAVCRLTVRPEHVGPMYVSLIIDGRELHANHVHVAAPELRTSPTIRVEMKTGDRGTEYSVYTSQDTHVDEAVDLAKAHVVSKIPSGPASKPAAEQPTSPKPTLSARQTALSSDATQQ